MDSIPDILYTWTPVDFGFEVYRLADTLEGTIWKKDNFLVRYLGNGFWLCTKKIQKGNKKEIVTNFCKKIKPEDREFAEWLLEKRL